MKHDGIEGDYEAIVDYLDTNPVINGVGFSTLHGAQEDGWYNVGLFSVNQDHFPDCYVCQGENSGKAMNTKFGEDIVEWEIDLAGYVVTQIENPESTHLIRF